MPTPADEHSRLEDEASIRTLTAQFAEAIMRRDADAFRAVWAESGHWSIGAPMSLEASGRDAIVSMLDRLWTGNDAFVHFAFPSVIEVSGDTATMTCMCQEAAKGPNRRFYRTSGIWTDELQRADAGWVFTRRAYQYLWLDFSPFEGDMFPLAPAAR